MATFRARNISRYDVRDPADPMLNIMYKVDTYAEQQKRFLTLRGAGLKSMSFPQILLPSTVYIIDTVSDTSSGEHDAGEDMTSPSYAALGLRILAKDSIPLGSRSATFAVMAHQYIEIDKDDVIATG